MPERDQVEVVPQDTIIEEIVIAKDDQIKEERKVWDDGVEDVVIVLPFNSYAHTMDGSHSFVLHFYSGLKNGFKYPQQNPKRRISIKVRDSRGFNTEMSHILSGMDSTNTDLIIGGFSKNNIQSLSNLSKKWSIPYVSPIFPSGAMNEDNPFHIQVTPGFDSHCRRLLDHIDRNHPQANVQIVCRSNRAERARSQKLRKMWSEINKDAPIGDEQEILIDWEDENTEFNFLGKFDRYGSNIFIIPSWSSESFVYSVLRQLSIDKGGSDVIVYGMPQWRSFELSSYEYYEDLNLRISTGANIDRQEDYEQVKEYLFEQFNYISSEKELLAYATGYDIGKYISTLVAKYGENWMEKLPYEAFRGMAVDFDFKRDEDPKVLVSDRPSQGALENQSVRILEFENYQFQPIR